jgi:sugar-specific transcriptional regulator TrmB
MKEDLINTLEETYFTKKEAETYVTLLEAGEATPAELGKRTKIGRVNTYQILESLKGKNAVSMILKDGRQTFFAVEPSKIIAILENKKEKLMSIEPELMKLSKLVEKRSKVTLFEGKKGIAELLQDVLDNAKEVFVYGNRENEKRVFFESTNYRKKRIEKGIKMFGVTDHLEESVFKEEGWKKNSEIRINEKLKDISTWIMIYESKVAILTSEKELLGIIIENEEIAKTHKFNFDLLWESGKEI